MSSHKPMFSFKKSFQFKKVKNIGILVYLLKEFLNILGFIPSLSSSIWLKLGILGAFMSGKWFSYWGAGVNGACGDGVPIGKNIIINLISQFVCKFMNENYT